MIVNYPQKYPLTHKKHFIYNGFYLSYQMKNRTAGETNKAKKYGSMKITYFSDE